MGATPFYEATLWIPTAGMLLGKCSFRIFFLGLNQESYLLFY